MKILLIQPPFYGFQNIISNRLYLGLAYLGAVLEKEKHEVLILNGELYFDKIKGVNEKITINADDYGKKFTRDHYVYQKILKDISEFKPDIIAISFMTAVSTSAYYLAQYIKKSLPDVPLIAGGIHPTLVPNEPLKNNFDFTVRGEGEITTVELINYINNKKDIEKITGISYKKNGQIVCNEDRPLITDLDTLPFPAFYLMKDYKKNTHSCKGIITSRGCPFACTYCASKLLWTQKVRFRSPQNVVNEIIDRHKKYNITSFAFHDDTFTLRQSYVKEFCQLALSLDFKITWHCDTRVDTIDLPLLKLMHKAGCRHIYLGLESGSPKIQKLIKKNINTEKVKQAIILSRRAGIETTVYFMAGFPDETEEDIKLSIKAMKELSPDYVIWSILTPYPGTEVWEIAKKQGLVDINNCDWEKYFHHYNQGCFFKTIPEEKWNSLIESIRREEQKINNQLTLLKTKKNIRNKLSQISYALHNPKKLFKYISKKICLQK
ncbi:B12-binding domain-containing radical SAM protein [Patescibacteria group bacterium]|nr:radical SAM protein [Candidatus Falkowbacteria bacterium]MBU3906170.1 B12-binding domain-containing radical SAM protein [Patescibacteria group bacterium]MCG2697500.1 B12-binding domain-containing radical SAM protein [Candidatus Parcubacteria bacterium]MBU4014990.1 B12-binding domain-containing radical SAM protein [Patescibacteria group bacterium]MBU4026663.1 B12-binding domain-containing radical SAM protein [Patescibacteria group bacterium]